jgi:quercetin dioxygenase-like cupin family protein
MADHSPIVLADREGELIWYDGGLITFKATGAQTEGTLLLFEARMPGGKATPLHVHPDADETLCLLEGEVMFHVAGTERSARAGGVVHVPRGIAHAFAVTSEEARLLVLFTPADAVSEAFFREAGEPADSATLPSWSPDLERLQSAAEKTGLQVLGPPPFAVPPAGVSR